MRTNLIFKDFKYLNLKKSIFYFLKYEKKMTNVLIDSNMKTLISFLFKSNNFLNKKTPRLNFFLFSDLVDTGVLSVEISKINDFKYLMYLFLFYHIQSQMYLLNSSSVVSFPNKKEIITLLRSPHTDKKSREQFRKLQYKKLLKGTLFFSSSFVRFLIKKEYITSKIRSKYIG